MTNAFTVTLCQCGHSPEAEHLYEKYACKVNGCGCREVVECQIYMSLDTRLPEIEGYPGALTQAIDRLKKWGNA